MSRLRPIIGHRFTRLVVVDFVGYRMAGQRSRRHYRCRCDCGAEVVAHQGPLASGQKTSCGCLTRERRTTHGQSKTRVYAVWRAMHARCSNPRNQQYKNYGARGIRVCKRWRDFAAFISDMGVRPVRGTLERKDVNGHYEPKNCRWATQTEQGNNKRVNVILALDGKAQTIAQWARQLHMNHSTIWYRIKHGWPTEEALKARWNRGLRTDLGYRPHV